MKCPSCMAANVAIATTIVMGITDQNIVGAARKSSNPVSLLAHVCGKQNRLKMTSADAWFTILMNTITPAQIHSQTGISTTGNSVTAQQTTKMMSATLSKTAPVLLSVWNLLASHPSTISLSPHSTYSVQNGQSFTSNTSRLTESATLSNDMAFGKCVSTLTQSQNYVDRNRCRSGRLWQ